MLSIVRKYDEERPQATGTRRLVVAFMPQKITEEERDERYGGRPRCLFQASQRGVAGAKRAAQKGKNGVFDRLRKVIGNFLRRRRQARIRKQLRVIHRWENARRA